MPAPSSVKTDSHARRVRRLSAVAIVGAFAVVVASEDACVLAQPPGEVPQLPESRPTIVHARVVPSTGAVLTRFPSEVIVPVELADPKATIQYSAFIDYNPIAPNGLVHTGQSSFGAANTPGRTRDVTIPLPLPPETELDPGIDLNRCHVIEVIVALRLESFLEPRGAHTPREPGGDLVTWFYNPSGDLGGCPSLDAGITPRLDGGS